MKVLLKSSPGKFRLGLPALAIICLSFFTVPSFAQDSTWFKDVSAQLGFNVVHAGAMIGLDVNNDEYPDLITLNGSGTDNGFKLYLNEQRPGSSDPKDRVFVDATDGSGINVTGMIKDLAAAADFNNDGNIDLVTNAWYFDSSYNFSSTDPQCPPNPDNGSRLHLLLGDGHGHFTLKQNSGLEDLGYMSGTGLPALDYDRDGNLDLFVCTHMRNWCFGYPEENYLMRGNGDGTFTDVSLTSNIGTSLRALFGANMADWNNDCNPDILTAPYESSGYGQLFQNYGNGTFADVAVGKGYNPHWMTGDHSGHFNPNMVPWAAMPCDYDNDGDVDFLVLLVHGAAAAGDGRTSIFTNGGASKGYRLTPDVNQITRNDPQNFDFGDHNGFWSDFDNDMLPDLVVGDAAYNLGAGYPDGQRMFFCLQNSSHHFNDITAQLGFIHGTDASGISDRIRSPSVMMPMDYDMDGDDDIFKCAYNGDDSLNFLVLRNDVANKNHYLEIKLVAPDGVNKSCIGARITVKAGGVKQMREIYAGQGSWTNEWPFTVNFGLKSTTMIDSIDVRWPNAGCTHTIVTNVPADQFVHIDKDGLTAAPVIKADNDFVVYPNPTNNVLTVGFRSTTKATIDIYNVFGQKVLSFVSQTGSDRVQIPVQNITPGAYWVHVSGTGLGVNATKPFIKL